MRSIGSTCSPHDKNDVILREPANQSPDKYFVCGEGLTQAKTKEINALGSEIEAKTARVGELGVQLVTEKEDLDDTTKSFA